MRREKNEIAVLNWRQRGERSVADHIVVSMQSNVSSTSCQGSSKLHGDCISRMTKVKKFDSQDPFLLILL